MTRPVSYEALEQRVYGVESGIAGINARLDTLSTQLQERNKPQWGLLVSLASLIVVVTVAIGGIAYAPIISGLYRMEQDYKERVADNRRELKDIQQALVSRGEHEQIWRSFTSNLSDHQRQLDEIKRSYSDIYSPKDALTTLQRRIDSLEQRIQR